ADAAGLKKLFSASAGAIGVAPLWWGRKPGVMRTCVSLLLPLLPMMRPVGLSEWCRASALHGPHLVLLFVVMLRRRWCRRSGSRLVAANWLGVAVPHAAGGVPPLSLGPFQAPQPRHRNV